MARRASLVVAALALALVLGALPGGAEASEMPGAKVAPGRPTPKILSASWGTDGKVGCPNGEQGLDNIPVTFNWFIRGDVFPPSAFRVVRSDGTVATPTCAIRFPPDENDEAQTVNLIGNFGDSANGPTPVEVRVHRPLEAKPPGAVRWSFVRHLAPKRVDPLSGGPYIVDAWTIMPWIYRADRNRCHYCLAAHTMLGRKAGASAEEMAEAQAGRSDDAQTAAAADGRDASANQQPLDALVG